MQNSGYKSAQTWNKKQSLLHSTDKHAKFAAKKELYSVTLTYINSIMQLRMFIGKSIAQGKNKM